MLYWYENLKLLILTWVSIYFHNYKLELHSFSFYICPEWYIYIIIIAVYYIPHCICLSVENDYEFFIKTNLTRGLDLVVCLNFEFHYKNFENGNPFFSCNIFRSQASFCSTPEVFQFLAYHYNLHTDSDCLTVHAHTHSHSA